MLVSIKESITKDPKMIMVIVQNIAIISLFCVTCVDIAIPTQVIVQKTTQKGGVAGVMFIATKVMIQLNGKSGAAL